MFILQCYVRNNRIVPIAVGILSEIATVPKLSDVFLRPSRLVVSVFQYLVLQLGVKGGVGHHRKFGRLNKALIEIVIYPRFAGFASLRCYNDYTICRP